MPTKKIKLSNYSPKTPIENSAVKFYELLSKFSECYFVGGYPRELLMSKILNKKYSVKDIDIAVKRKKGKDIKDFFEANNIEYKVLNENFGVYSVFIDSYDFQLAYYRKDGKTSDGRRPDSVKFVNNIKKDSSRRDFTMNAFYFNPIKKVVYDFHNGIKDIKKERIRFIGNTKRRINEDYLRILRYFRFKSKYAFESDFNDEITIKEYCNELSNISKERIKIELDSDLTLQNINLIFCEFDKFNILNELLPEFKRTQGILLKIDDNSIDVSSYILKCLKTFSSKTLFNVLKKYLYKDFDKLQNIKDIKEYIIDNFGIEILWSCFFYNLGKIIPEYEELENGETKIIFNDYEKMSYSIAMDIMRKYGFSKNSKEIISYLLNKDNYQFNNLKNKSDIEKKKIIFNDNFIKVIILNIVFLIADLDDEEEAEKTAEKEFGEYIKIYNETIEDKKKISKIANKALLEDFDFKDGQKYENIMIEISNAYIEGSIKSETGVIKFLENKTGKLYYK